ncbi:unnamed protein product [Meloidogyne enterolobii]|uniref:Uncharacterized protein n=1 Tax=Meloidogyne enterolobii TaxID=390850 RepID=A0ACB1B5S0_MELEN
MKVTNDKIEEFTTKMAILEGIQAKMKEMEDIHRRLTKAEGALDSIKDSMVRQKEKKKKK